jgi:uncharacterized protein involved in type VI secretion and phage assembly
MTRYYGKYRGKVTNNLDPDNLGRLQVSVPAVFGDFTLNWALPSVPYAGMQNCFYAIPPIEANVWVEFEAGDPEIPIWSGCFWGTGEVPSLATQTLPTIPHLVFQTTAQTTLMLNDDPTAGILLKTATGAKIEINATGITIDNGTGASIKLTATGAITITGTPTDINNSALTVN